MLEVTEKLVKVVPLNVVWPAAGTENKYLIIQITETIERICNCHLPAAVWRNGLHSVLSVLL